jgi:hypothetical protein
MTDLAIVSGYGGPSVLSDDMYIYTATILEIDGPNENIKFSMTDAETMEQFVLYRNDFPALHTISQRVVWNNPLNIVLFGQGVLYYIEMIANTGTSGYKFYLMKVDFMNENISQVYYKETLGNEYYRNVPNFFMTFKGTNQLSYLAWDVNVLQDVEINTYNYIADYSYDTVLEELTCGGVFDTEVDYYTWEVSNGASTRLSSLLSRIDCFVYNLETEELVREYTLWNNSDIYNMYDEITGAAPVPSQIYFNDYIYSAYVIRNEGHFFCTSAIPQVTHYVDTGPFAPFYAYRNVCTALLPAKKANMHITQYQYTTRFLGNLFWLLVKTNPLTGETSYKEVSNGRTGYTTSYNYPGPFAWWADCENGIPLGCDLPEPNYGFSAGVDGDYDGGIPLPLPPHADLDDMVLFNNPAPYKMVLDVDTENLYVKVGQPDATLMSPPAQVDWSITQEELDARKVGIFKISTADISNIVLTMYETNLECFDLLMSIEHAYLLVLDEAGMGLVYRLSDGDLVSDVGLQYFGGYTLEEWDTGRFGTRMTQQATTDEKRIWKLIPYDDDNFKIIGYNLEAGSNREYTIIAPFSMVNLGFFNLHQHDGRFVITTEDNSFDPPLIGVWVIT